MRLLHVINLRGHGGLEHLFAAYFTATPAQANGWPAVAVKSHMHPGLHSAIASAGRHHYGLKNWGPIRLPAVAGLRRWNIGRIVAKAAPERVVFWSTLPGPEWHAACERIGADIVYYDHGHAWDAPVAEARAALACVRRVVTVSRAGRRMIQERLGHDGEIDVVANGLRLAAPDAPRSYCPDGRLRIGFAGRNADVKGLPVLLAAAGALAQDNVEFELHIAGSGTDGGTVRNLCRRRGIEDRVVLHGAVADMVAFYRSIDTLAVPSLREPFGLASIEAAACGAVPVVAAVDGLPETLEHGTTGLALPPTLPLDQYEALGGGTEGLPERVYDPATDTLASPRMLDPATLAGTLADLAVAPDRIAAMGAAASRLTCTRFARERFVEQLDATLTRI